MRIVKVNLGERSHNIYIGSASLDKLGRRLKSELGNSRQKVFVISNSKVFSLYGERVTRSLNKNSYGVFAIIIPDGEKYKNLKTVGQIYDRLIKNKAERSSVIVALGGGVVGDIAGFAAATFLRGIDFIQIPTTLLAQVDSAIGGKVGVNHTRGKNLIGAFHQPKLVWIDPSLLKTLPEREFRAGFYEVIKYGIIGDATLFEEIERNLPLILARNPRHLEKIITRCCAIKARLVSQDERESNLRAILNFGHTIGHALEAATHYAKFKHGEAVAWGMIGATRLSARVGTLTAAYANRIEGLIRRVGKLPRASSISFARVRSALLSDKKIKDGQVRFVLPSKIGQAVIQSSLRENTTRQIIEELFIG